MTEAQRIKKSYCRPAIYINEVELKKYGNFQLPSHFHVERYIWVDQLLPEYRVAIPERVSEWADDEVRCRELRGGGIQMRFITYIPTGRQVYDNTLPELRAVVFEYQLEHYAKRLTAMKGSANGDSK